MEITIKPLKNEALESIAKRLGVGVVVEQQRLYDMRHSARLDYPDSPEGTGVTVEAAIHALAQAVSFQTLIHGGATVACERVYWAFPDESAWAQIVTVAQKHKIDEMIRKEAKEKEERLKKVTMNEMYRRHMMDLQRQKEEEAAWRAGEADRLKKLANSPSQQATVGGFQFPKDSWGGWFK